MKRGLFFLAIAFIGITSFGQTLHRGNLIGLHVYTPILKQGVTQQEYIKFYTSKVIPAYDKAFPGMKTYLVTSLRGQDSTSFGIIYLFDTESDRNKYFDMKTGEPTELFTKANAKLDAITKEMDKYETSSNAPGKYNDWLVK